MTDSNTEFMRMQQQAVERMREMSNRSVKSTAHTMPPTPSFVKVENYNTAYKGGTTTGEKQIKTTHTSNMHKNEFPLNLTARLRSEPDIALIIGLLLILWSEQTDKRLLLALIYILF